MIHNVPQPSTEILMKTLLRKAAFFNTGIFLFGTDIYYVERK
jgi:hypothetical protein